MTTSTTTRDDLEPGPASPANLAEQSLVLPRWIDDRLPHINIEGSAARAQVGVAVEARDDTAFDAAEAEAA